VIDLTNCRALAPEPAPAEARLQTLERIVLDLMMEIEALRAAVIELSSRTGPVRESADAFDDGPAGVAGPHSAYGKAYLEAAWLSHWAAGPSSGDDKILEQFYDNQRDDSHREFKMWRELLMLRRLGYNEAQLRQYVENARAAETCT
jgi:hypothetical protein